MQGQKTEAMRIHPDSLLGEWLHRRRVQRENEITAHLERIGAWVGRKPADEPARHDETADPLISFQEATLRRMRDAKKRHAERSKDADADEVAFSEQMMADEITAIKAEYERTMASYTPEGN